MTFLPLGFAPGLLLVAFGLLAAALPRDGRNAVGLIGVLLSAGHLSAYGTAPLDAPLLYGVGTLAGLETVAVRIDNLSRIFAVIFHVAALFNVVYGWRHATRLEASMGLVYAGAAIAGAMAGDLLTLFVYWELAALSSVFLVWAGGGHAAFKAGMRYLVVQVTSGLLLLAGIAVLAGRGDGVAFTAMSLSRGDGSADLASWLILVSFGIKAAFPLLHTWLQDSYPKASPVGAVMLSAFTTKLAIYTLARGFAGADLLIPVGCVMVAFPVFFALIENDLRKVLAYSLNNQLGFMVCAIGIGTPLAINGASAHAFVHIIYKALLFMGMGAVMVRVGTAKATELGGLHKSMPLTTVFTLIGALSISAFPLFSGFVAKSMITDAASGAHLLIAYLVLLFASAGVLEHSGIKIPYFAFFAHDNFAPSVTGRDRPREAPLPMLVAMGLAAAACVWIGVWPGVLYGLLPYEIDYHAYTPSHVVTQMQLLLFAILAFALLVRFRLYPAEVRAQNLDVDWFWRVPGRLALMSGVAASVRVWRTVWGGAQRVSGGTVRRFYATHGPEGGLARTWAVGYTALTTAAVLAVALILVFLAR